MISYRSSLRFIPVQWLDFEIWPNNWFSPLFFAMLGDIDLIFGIWVYNDELQIKCTLFRSSPMIFGRVPVIALGLWNLAKYLVVTTFLSLWFEILTWFLVCECIVMSYWSSLNFIPIEWYWANLHTKMQWLLKGNVL
jgi:hypothetical protein